MHLWAPYNIYTTKHNDAYSVLYVVRWITSMQKDQPNAHRKQSQYNHYGASMDEFMPVQLSTSGRMQNALDRYLVGVV